MATHKDTGKARRQLQRKAHADQGGDPDLTALTNAAADELLARPPASVLERTSDFESVAQA